MMPIPLGLDLTSGGFDDFRRLHPLSLCRHGSSLDPRHVESDVLGDGKRLFGSRSEKLKLRLASSRTVGDGVAILIYERA